MVCWRRAFAISRLLKYNNIQPNFIKGDEVIKLEKKMDPVIGKQVALEYLVKLLYTLDYQLKIKIVKLRAFLLWPKQYNSI